MQNTILFWAQKQHFFAGTFHEKKTPPQDEELFIRFKKVVHVFLLLLL